MDLKLTLTSTTVHPVEVHKQSHQASRRARTLEYCPHSCRRTTRVKIFVEIISRMTCNSRNSRKFRPAKFKRYTVALMSQCPAMGSLSSHDLRI